MPSTETFRGEGEIGNYKIISPIPKKAYFRYLPQPPEIFVMSGLRSHPPVGKLGFLWEFSVSRLFRGI